jgi:hypothetical protein
VSRTLPLRSMSAFHASRAAPGSTQSSRITGWSEASDVGVEPDTAPLVKYALMTASALSVHRPNLLRSSSFGLDHDHTAVVGRPRRCGELADEPVIVRQHQRGITGRVEAGVVTGLHPTRE